MGDTKEQSIFKTLGNQLQSSAELVGNVVAAPFLAPGIVAGHAIKGRVNQANPDMTPEQKRTLIGEKFGPFGSLFTGDPGQAWRRTFNPKSQENMDHEITIRRVSQLTNTPEVELRNPDHYNYLAPGTPINEAVSKTLRAKAAGKEQGRIKDEAAAKAEKTHQKQRKENLDDYAGQTAITTEAQLKLLNPQLDVRRYESQNQLEGVKTTAGAQVKTQQIASAGQIEAQRVASSGQIESQRIASQGQIDVQKIATGGQVRGYELEHDARIKENETVAVRDRMQATNQLLNATLAQGNQTLASVLGTVR